MRLYYIDESEGPRRYVRTALGVDAERWNDLFGDIYQWRRELQDRYAIPTDKELHACDLLAGRGMLARNGGSNERLSPRQGAEVFLDGLRRIEDASVRIGGIDWVGTAPPITELLRLVCAIPPAEPDVQLSPHPALHQMS